MGHRQRRAQFSDTMVRQRRRNLGSHVDQVEGQRPGQGERGSWTLSERLSPAQDGDTHVRSVEFFCHSRARVCARGIPSSAGGREEGPGVLEVSDCVDTALTRARQARLPSPWTGRGIGRTGEETRGRQKVRGRRGRIEYQVKKGRGFNRPNIKREMPLVEDIVSAVAEATHIAPAEIRGRSRRQRIAYARQLAMYLMRQITRASYPLIGAFFGRNHSTVIYACESIRARLPFDAEGRRALDKIATIFSDRLRE